jgi:hypothetical protein
MTTLFELEVKMEVDLREAGALIVRAHKSVPFYEAKWRDATRKQRKRRLGRAWLEPDPDGGWRKRRGRSAMASSTRSVPTGR